MTQPGWWTKPDLRNGATRLPARCVSPSFLSIPSISCYPLVGWSDDRVDRWLFPIRSMLLPRLIHPMGFNGSPFLLDPESVPRVVCLSFRSSIVGKKLYVGNLTYNVNESDLEALFTPFGTVQSARSS